MTDYPEQQSLNDQETGSYAQWLKYQHRQLDEAGIPRSATRRTEIIVKRGLPSDYIVQAIRDSVSKRTGDLLRKGGRAKADSQGVYHEPEQLTLAGLEDFIRANYDKRLADEESELAYVQAACQTHSDWGLTAAQIYDRVGIKMPDPNPER